MMIKTTVVIPTYNEANNLPVLAEELFALPYPQLQMLVVDDASPDGTGEVAERLAQQYPGRVHVFHRLGKDGLGSAYIEGFTWAQVHGSEFIIQMDADFSHSPAYLPVFLDLIHLQDVVVGSRYIPEGQLDQRWGLGRKLLSWWANSVWVRMILGLKTRDATVGFKCWRRSALEEIGIQYVKSNGYVFQVEMAYLAEKAGLRILETPIYFEDRRIGKSKMSMKEKVAAAVGVFAIRRQHRQRVLELAHLRSRQVP